MATMEASQHVYVVKVRTLPDPSLLFPSERRYSALTVAGLAAGHALLGGVAVLLGVLALSWDPPRGPWGGPWVGHLGAGLWLGLAALQASVCGLLAWRRWYEDRYIAWFFRASLVAALVAAAGLVLTSAALAHLHENIISPHHELHAFLAPPPELAGDLAVADGGNASGVDSASWLDLVDSNNNSSTISSGGVFSDLVRDQDHQHDEDLLAADSARHEKLAELGEQGDRDDGDLDWSVLRRVQVSQLSPRASAQIRSLVAVNVLVACFLELLWSLLGARVAWRGMQSADLAHATPAPSSATAAPVVLKASRAPMTALERGAADGKVDMEADIADGDLKRDEANQCSRTEKKARKKQQQQQQTAATRRRAPECPELSLEQRTMDLEERVARYLDRTPQGQDERAQERHDA